jgi:hypothetical protein
VASPKTGTSFRSFPFTTSSLFALAWGFQGTKGAPINHELPNQKFVNRQQLFYILLQDR